MNNYLQNIKIKTLNKILLIVLEASLSAQML